MRNQKLSQKKGIEKRMIRVLTSAMTQKLVIIVITTTHMAISLSASFVQTSTCDHTDHYQDNASTSLQQTAKLHQQQSRGGKGGVELR